MRELSFEEIIDLAKDKGLEVWDRCLEYSGYPRTNKDGIITGFDDYESLQEFIDEIGMGESALFKRKDGWHRTFQYYVGYMGRSLTAEDYVKDLGDNYNILYDFDSEIDYIKEVVSEIISRGDIMGASKYLVAQACLQEAYNDLSEDEVIVMSGGEWYETVEKEMMKYSEDTWTWEVGILVPYFITELNNENDK